MQLVTHQVNATDSEVIAIDHAVGPPSGSGWHEVFTVVAIILAALAIVCFGYALVRSIFVGSGCKSKAALVKVAIAPDGTISSALRRFERERGRYPTQLIELATTPIIANDDADAKPYLDVDLKTGFHDPWGSEYRFRYPAQRSRHDFDLWSCGPDGISGTRDDITNW